MTAARTGSSMATEDFSSSSATSSYLDQLDEEAIDRSLYQSYLHHHITLLRSFIQLHYHLIVASYPLLSSTAMCRKICYYILQSIVYDSLSQTLLSLYEDVYHDEDEWMVDRLRTRRAQAAKQRESGGEIEEWKQPRDDRSHTVELLRDMLTATQIREKLALIVSVCKRGGGGRADGGAASTDDLISLLCKCLLYLSAPMSSAGCREDEFDVESSTGATCVSHLYSHVRMLNECMDESMFIGEKGFCMTTLTVALQALAAQDDEPHQRDARCDVDVAAGDVSAAV